VTGGSVRVLLFTLVLAAALTMPAAAWAQSTALPDQPLLGSTLTADLVRDLPTGNNPFAVLETIQPEVIGDLFSAGGLNTATASPFGGFLNSWTHTEVRIGDVGITDPRTGGTPLLLPFLPLWERMTIATGAMGVADGAPALSLTLDALRPGTTWSRVVEGSLSGGPLVSETTVPVSAIDRVHQWQDASLLLSGPVTSRLGLVAAGSWRGLSHVTQASPVATDDRIASAFAHLVFAATPRDEIRVLGWVQGARTAATSDSGVHVQTTWERRASSGLGWRVFGGYTERTRSSASDHPPTTTTVDSLVTAPVSDLFDTGIGTSRRWTVGARAIPGATSRLPALGIDLDGAEVRIPPAGVQQIRELVDGQPSRIWTIQSAAGNDVRHLTPVALHANEHLVYKGVSLDAGLRLETLSGSANGSTQAVQWATLLPRALVRWQLTNVAGLAVVAGYRRTAYRTPLNVLAVGDPNAPVADVATWNGTATGPLFARVGPGTGGNPALTRIDANLARPTTDELVFALESRPLPGVQVVLARVTKREQQLLSFADTGVASSSYTAFQVPDSSFLPGSEDGGPLVTVYNRPPDSYGRDRYLLTNLSGEDATFWGIDLSVRVSASRLTLLAGGTLTEVLGPAAAVGYLPTGNDQDVLGNLLVDRNASTSARGQLFPDRSHVVKIAGIYRLPWNVHVGAIARYQDGQPFSRVVIVPDLVQGRTAVRGYPNGGTAFTYIGTLDVRVQKLFRTGRSQVAAGVDVYNLPNLGNEVAENVVSGPNFRAPTALQPPRTVLASLRVTF
jgi:hypothetical protein